MDAASLAHRSVATLRARFEALRPESPIPALMAEIPAGHPSPFDEGEPHPRPPVVYFHRADLFYLGFGTIFGPPQASGPVALAQRCLWLAGPSVALNRLRAACRDAAGFVSAIRGAAGLPVGSGARSAESDWLWTMFEVAERRVAFSPLQLRGGSVTVAHGECHFPEAQVAAVRAHPETGGVMANIIRAADPGPTRYWDIVDAVEASLMLLDLAAEALSESPAAPDSQALPMPKKLEPTQPVEGPRKRGRKYKQTVEGLTVDQWVAAMAAGDLTFRHLSEREAKKLGPFGARTIGSSPIWKQMKADLETEARERAEQAKAELEGRQIEDEDPNGLRFCSTKSAIGRQRAAPEDSEHERSVDAFLRSKGEQVGRKRAK